LTASIIEKFYKDNTLYIDKNKSNVSIFQFFLLSLYPKLILNKDGTLNTGNYQGLKPKEARKKISLANSGEKSYLWQGGISFKPYPLDWTRTLRMSIRERDKYTCQKCGIKQTMAKGKEVKIEIHHKNHVLNWGKIFECIKENLFLIA
jgi:hypothetical protein